jgi:D-sedoheptulose 7-phosphate isomerase
MNKHLAELIERRPRLNPILPEIEKALVLITGCYRNGGKVLVCGNGGSCADADHIVGELMKSFILPRPLDDDLRLKLETSGEPDLALKLQTPMRALNLCSMPSLSTAFANDVNPDYVFAQLTLGYTDPGDVFIGISTSGNSKSVRYAAVTAKAKGAYLIGLTGEDGGKMKESGIYDALIRAPEKITHLIQEEHIAIYHAICLAAEDEMYGK